MVAVYRRKVSRRVEFFFFFFKPVQTKVSVLHLSTSPFFYAKEMFDVDNTNFKGSTTRITVFFLPCHHSAPPFSFFLHQR